MSQDAPAGGSSADAEEQPPESTLASYAARLGDAAKWGAGALAAVATTAVTKLSLDRLGTGQVDRALVFWAYVGLCLFAIGVTSLVAVVIWHARASRVTLGYLLSNHRLAKRIRHFLEENPYLFGGPQTLLEFRDDLNEIQRNRRERPLTAAENSKLQNLLVARDAILQTAKAERVQIVSGRATAIIMVAALLVTLGAATFALATNRDVVLRDDRLAQEERDRQDVVTGELLPKTPSDITIIVPKKFRDDLQAHLGEDCPARKLDGILIDIASPTPGEDTAVVPRRRAVFHVVTLGSKKCAADDIWTPPAWVIARVPDATSESQAEGTETGQASGKEINVSPE